jgi:hypothetical protein
VLLTLCVAVLGVAIRVRRPQAALTWWVLFAGVCAFSLRSWSYGLVRLDVLDADLLPFLDMPLFLVAYACTVGASSRYVRLRTGGRDLDGLIDAAIVGCAAAVVVKQWIVPADGLGDATTLALYVVMEAVVVAIAVRLLLLSSDCTAGWLLFVGSVAGFAANLATSPGRSTTRSGTSRGCWWAGARPSCSSPWRRRTRRCAS